MDRLGRMRALFLGALILAASGAAGHSTVGSVVGTVMDPGNLPLPGVQVTIESPTPMAGAHTDRGGHFILDGISPGVYTLRLEKAGFEPKELKIRTEDGEPSSLGVIGLEFAPVYCLGEFRKPILEEKKLDSPEKTRVSGTVREGIAPLRKMYVGLRDLGAGGADLITRTDANGKFEFEGVPPGSYELRIPDAAVKLKVRAKSGRALEVRLNWKAPASPCL
jgi:hypothetical protein